MLLDTYYFMSLTNLQQYFDYVVTIVPLSHQNTKCRPNDSNCPLHSLRTDGNLCHQGREKKIV
jgi:hypothetical protein